MRKGKKYLPLLAAGVVAAIWLAAGVLPQLAVRRQPLTDFAAVEAPTYAVAEAAERGSMYCHLAACSVPLGEATEVFDYTQGQTLASMALRQQLALVREGVVYRLPTVATRRDDLWQQLDLPQYIVEAEEIEQAAAADGAETEVVDAEATAQAEAAAAETKKAAAEKAAAQTQRARENFYVGLQSRVLTFLLPRGDYQLAVLQQGADGVWRLLTLGEVTL